MTLPRYPAYKDSAVDWLGEVPVEWETKPFFSIATERNESNFGMIEDNLLSLSYGQIVNKDISSNDGLLPESFSTYQIVHPGDIVFRLTDLQNDKRSLRTAIVKQKGIITSAYLAAKSTGIQPDFLNHLLRAYDLSKIFYSMGGGLRQSMKFSDIKRLPILVPPFPEQQAIADFLNHETARIDALVAEQQTLIALLKEKRQAVISHAVTRGLDPNVPLKDSGVEWLGEVPEHWITCTVRRIIRKIEQGWSPECNSRPAENNEWGVLKAGCVNRGVYNESENKALPDYLQPLINYEVVKGDILMSRASGSPELVGSVAFVEDTRPQLMLSDKIFRLYLAQNYNPRFFTALFNSILLRSQIEQSISGADGLANNLPQASLKNFFIPVPPLPEQQAIAAFLDTETARIDTLITEAEKGIELLKERRSALISAAVTGQIDVRNWQAPEAVA